MESSFTRIYVTSDPSEAGIITQMLSGNGIHAVSLNKKDSSYLAFGVIEIYCPAEQVVTALHLINNDSKHEK